MIAVLEKYRAAGLIFVCARRHKRARCDASVCRVIVPALGFPATSVAGQDLMPNRPWTIPEIRSLWATIAGV